MIINCHIREYITNQHSDGTNFTLPGSTADRYTYAYSYDSFGWLTESARYAGFSMNPNNIFTEKNLTYDRNGNMTLDALRNITLTYDINNLVSTVSRNDTLLSTYHYFADGTKYKVIDPDNNGRVYIGPFSYTTAKSGNTVYSYLEGIDTDGGRIMIVRKQSGTQNTYDYTTAFFVKDHLGSTRVMLNAQGDILERNAYYPFGLQMNQGKAYPTLTERLPQLYAGYISSTPARRDIYNGKELQTAAGTDYLDYGFRQYDQTIARWFNIDPKAEKYLPLTPYNYCAGNPVSLIDFRGDSLWVKYRDAQYLYMNGSLYNPDGSLYEGKQHDFISDVIMGLEQLAATEEGKRIIDDLQQSDYGFYIEYRNDNGFKPDDSKYAASKLYDYLNYVGIEVEPKGSGGTIYWNPLILYSGFNLDGTMYRPPFIGLGHEMAHASDSNNGLLHAGRYAEGEPLSITNFNIGVVYEYEYNGLLKSEWNAVYRENLIRQQAGISLRAYYFVDISSGNPAPFGPRLLTSDNKPINYPNIKR